MNLLLTRMSGLHGFLKFGRELLLHSIKLTYLTTMLAVRIAIVLELLLLFHELLSKKFPLNLFLIKLITSHFDFIVGFQDLHLHVRLLICLEALDLF